MPSVLSAFDIGTVHQRAMCLLKCADLSSGTHPRLQISRHVSAAAKSVLHCAFSQVELAG